MKPAGTQIVPKAGPGRTRGKCRQAGLSASRSRVGAEPGKVGGIYGNSQAANVRRKAGSDRESRLTPTSVVAFRTKGLRMKFGFRIPSLKKRIAARTSWKRFARHSLGLKAPRGWGWLTNPKKAAYNRIYNRTTVGLAKGCLVSIGVSASLIIGLTTLLLWLIR